MTIQEYLKLKGLTYRQAAKILGVSPTALHAWCNGDRKPKNSSIEKLAIASEGMITFDLLDDSGKAYSI